MGISKENRRLWKMGLFYTAIILVIIYFIPRQHNWTPSFSKDFDWPFGSELVYNHLTEVFTSDSILDNNVSFYESLKGKHYSNHNLIIINTKFFPDSLDRAELYRFVSEGNQVFISSNRIDRDLMDSLGCKLNNGYNTTYENLKEGQDAVLGMNFINEDLAQKEDYLFKAQRMFKHIIRTDSLKELYSIGTINEEYFGFVRIPYGAGNFYIHSFPFAFTNYHFLKEYLSEYISTSLSYLPNQRVIWDEFYKDFRADQNKPILHIMFESKAFTWAYWVAVCLLVLFILFYAKRKQRIIPVIKPYRNESLDFVKTISALYFQNKDNHDLAKKKISYFREYLHSNYHIKRQNFSDEDALIFVSKSGINKDLANNLFRQIRNIVSGNSVSDAQLKTLVKRLNQVYNYH